MNETIFLKHLQKEVSTIWCDKVLWGKDFSELTLSAGAFSRNSLSPYALAATYLTDLEDLGLDVRFKVLDQGAVANKKPYVWWVKVSVDRSK